MSLTTIPLSKLVLSPLNVRQTDDNHDTTDLEASIAAHGMLSHLIVHKMSKPRGAYGVLAGGRRLRALGRLRDQGTLPADHPVDVEIREADEATSTEISVIENTARVALPPVEEFQAFAKLAASGDDVAAIAQRFGTTELHVKQRMRLGQLHPEVLAALAAGRMTLDTAKAYAGTSDLALQKRILDQRLAYDYEVRAAIKRDVANAGVDRMLKLVTMDAYTSAGGRAEEDLFTPGEAQILDVDLLKRLYDVKLADEREALQLPDNVTLQFDHAGIGIPVEVVEELTDEQSERMRAIDARIEEIGQRMDAIADLEMDGASPRWVASAGENQDEVANLAAEEKRLEAEADSIMDYGFPDGPVIAIAEIIDGGLRIKSCYRPLGWRPAPIGGVASTAATIAPTSPAATADAPKPVINGFRQDRAAYSGVYRQPEEVAREEHGLTIAAVEVMRSHQRQILSAAMLDGPTAQRLSHRFLLYVLARGMLRPGDSSGFKREGAADLGVHSLPGHDPDPGQARPDLAEQPAAQAVREEIEWLRSRSWMTEVDPAKGLRLFTNVMHAEFERVGAIVATAMLSRSLGVPGFRVSTHDVIAELLDVTSKARLHFTPDKMYFARLSKSEKLKALEFVSPALAKRLSSKGADDLSAACALVMSGTLAAAHEFGLSDAERQRADGWVPPYLSFDPEEVDADEDEAA